jgi:hypothetical protein
MSVYCTNEAAFELPAIGLVDRTVTVLEARSPEGFAHAILIERRPRPAGKSLAELVAGNLRDARVRLPGHEVLFTHEIVIAGAEAIDHAVQWRGERGIVHARQVSLAADEAWLILAGSCEIEDRARCDATMDHIIRTFRFRA